MASQRGGRLSRQQRLRVRDIRVRIPVAQAGFGDSATGDDPEAVVAVRAAERPRRDPVDAAHVAGEEGGHDRQTCPAGDVGDRDEPVEHFPLRLIGRRLEGFPGQEQPDRVKSAGRDPGEVGDDLLLVEVCPPAHCGASRPVVEADPETLARL